MASLAAAPPSAHSYASLENDKSALGAHNVDPEKAGSGYDQEVRPPFAYSLFCGFCVVVLRGFFCVCRHFADGVVYDYRAVVRACVIGDSRA